MDGVVLQGDDLDLFWFLLSWDIENMPSGFRFEFRCEAAY